MDFQDARAAQSKESQTSQHGSRRAFLIWPGTWRMQRCLLDGSEEGRWRQWEGQIQGPQDKTESPAEDEESCLWCTIWLRGRREEKIWPTVRVLNLRENTGMYPAWECRGGRQYGNQIRGERRLLLEFPSRRLFRPWEQWQRRSTSVTRGRAKKLLYYSNSTSVQEVHLQELAFVLVLPRVGS